MRFKNDWCGVENIVDFEMYLSIEKRLRGEISYIAKRYAKANNKYMKDYDLKRLLTYILHLDMNNFHDWAVSGYLPCSGFKWLKNVDWFDINSISENSLTGYILEVDLEYLDVLLVLHNDYPLAPEKLAIPFDMLLDYCKKIADEYGINVGDVVKFIPHLGKKTIYAVHYRNLQLYLSLGMKLTKIHKVLKLSSLTG